MIARALAKRLKKLFLEHQGLIDSDWGTSENNRRARFYSITTKGTRQLERETAQLPDHSDARSAAQHITRLTSEIISEVAEHQATGDDPAGHRDKCHHRGGGDDTAVRDLSG